MHLWLLPHGGRGAPRPAASWMNNHPDGCRYTPNPRCLHYDDVHRFLYAADDAGYVSIVDVSDTLERYDLVPPREGAPPPAPPDPRQPKLFSLPRGDSLKRARNALQSAM
eukprot:gene7016-17898_t